MLSFHSHLKIFLATNPCDLSAELTPNQHTTMPRRKAGG